MNTDTIYKYTVEPFSDQRLSIPNPCQFLDVQMQRGKICLWYRVPYSPTSVEPVRIVVVGTGHPLPAGTLIHLGTVQQPEYESVWHIFALQA